MAAGELPAAVKSATALRTIGELSRETGLPQHVLRYWETRFPQLRPIQRAGNRRYYRPEDTALVVRIARLLNHDGYTVRGVQKLLASERAPESGPPQDSALHAIRDALARALAEDAA